MTQSSIGRGCASTRTANVIVGFDGSRSSEHALAYAAGVSRRTGGALLVAYIAAGGTSIGQAPFTPEAATAWRAYDASRVRKQAEELLKGTGTTWQFTTVYGEAAAGIEQLGERHRADLLVVGRSRVPVRHVFGSVPARLARHARCPITVVS